MFWIRRALDKADYGEALRRCRLLLRFRGSSHALRLTESSILLMAGRAAEAESQLRALLASDGEPPAGRAETCRLLGDALAAQCRRDEAIAMYQAALELDPLLGAVRPRLAEWELECGNADRAQDMASGERWSTISREDSAVAHAGWARVLARLERFAEAMAMVDRATREAMRLKSKPAKASAYWRIGQAHLALRNDGQAMVAFENARQVDPEGYYGKLAAQAISQAA
jgi:tetratricopeptide (TPR) repeat protein